MRIPIAREGYPFIVAATLPALALGSAAATVGSGLLIALAALFTVLALVVTAFFRDPERRGPVDSGLVLAPADGKIIEVATVDEDSYLRAPATRVSIFLSLFDVHVNRYPVSGSVEHRDYEPGRFEPAWRRSASYNNERSSTGIRGDDVSVLVRQIAGLAAKRVVTYARVGDRVRRGDRMGLIRFGSRVDLFLPQEAEVVAAVGGRAVGGVTVIAQLPPGPQGHP